MFLEPLPDKKLDEILNKLRLELNKLLDDRLEGIYLYGSQARGDARPGSDIDILMVIKGDFNYFDMIEKTADITAKLSLENDVLISSAFTSVDNFMNLNTPFLMNVRREGVKV